MMISMRDNDGNVLELSNGSDVYFKNADGEDIHFEWDEFNEDVLREIGKTKYVKADDINGLVESFEGVAEDIREEVNSHYQLEYCSPKRRANHTLKVDVTYTVKDEDGMPVENEDGSIQKLTGTIKTCFCAAGFQGGCDLSN